MTEKDLKKLNRYQLLELLIVQTERADKLQERLDAVEKKLRDQELSIATMGSIAEVSLQLGGVFEAAQKSADLYLREARERAEEIEATAKKKADLIISNAMDVATILNKL